MRNGVSTEPLVFATHLNRYDGWGRVAYEVAKAWSDTGIGLRVVTRKRAKNECIAGIRCIDALASTRWTSTKVFKAKLDALRVLWTLGRTNTVVAFDEQVILAAGNYALLSGADLTVILHGTYAVKMLQPPFAAAHRAMLDHAKTIVAVSSYTARRVIEVHPDLEPKISVWGLGVDEASVVPNGPVFDQTDNTVVTIGEIKKRKGADLLLRALSAIPPRERPVLKIIGAINEASDYVIGLRQFVRDHGLDDHVVFLGKVSHDDLEMELRKARIMAVPSQSSDESFEGFGLVHLEANARGLPSIGTTDSGNEDAIRDGQTGYLVGQSDHAELARRIVDLSTNETLWTKMSAAAVAHARANSWSVSAQRLASLGLGSDG